ncbi:MAG: hypothetical protein HY711_00615 [Candidatus Melainabacteria bacterium]|nr:hypothetical protein [Candidatus Melainabacteria bacterium]
MLAWVNLHPGFLVGLVLLLIYLGSDLAMAAVLAPGVDRETVVRRVKWLSRVLVIVLLVSLVNPYGLELYSYVGRYFQGSKVLAFTDEYQSPTFHGDIQSVCFEVLLAFVLAGLASSQKRLYLSQIVSIIAFGALALMSVRNIPVFVVVALPIIAELFATAKPDTDDSLSTSRTAQWWQAMTNWWQKLDEEFGKTESNAKMHLLPIVAVIVLWLAATNDGNLFGSTLLSSNFDPQSFPTKTLNYIRDHHLAYTKGFNYDNWGGYVRYKLGIPVFIDDRADFYGEKFYLDYGTVSLVSPGWSSVLNHYNINWILFPKTSQLSSRLQEEHEWSIACQDPAAYLFERKPAPR